MKRVYLPALALACALCIAGCGNQPAANNSTANANTRSANSNSNAMSSPADTASTETEIHKLMDAASTALAKNDADAMEKIYADNYVLVNIDGSVQTKAERLASLRSGDAKYTAFSYSEPNIRINPEGNGAIVIAKLSMKGVFRGKPTDGDYRVTQVYSKTKDGWKQVSAQATEITASSSSGANTSNSNTKSNTAASSTSSNSNR